MGCGVYSKHKRGVTDEDLSQGCSWSGSGNGVHLSVPVEIKNDTWDFRFLVEFQVGVGSLPASKCCKTTSQKGEPRTVDCAECGLYSN